MTTRTFTFNVTSNAGPTWFNALPTMTWVEVARGSTTASTTDYAGNPLPVNATGAWQNGNAVQQVAQAWGTSFRNAFEDSYCGASVDQDRKQLIYMAGGGGRSGNWPGNDGYALDLNRDTPAWYRLNDYTPLGSVIDTAASPLDAPAAYLDGRMRASHHYARQVCANSRVWWAGQDQYYDSAGGKDGRGIWSFNLNAYGVPQNADQPPLAHDGGAGPWTSHGTGITNTEVAAGQFSGGAAAYDPVTNLIWSFSASAATYAKWFTVNASTGAVVDRCNFAGTLNSPSALPSPGATMLATCRGSLLPTGLLVVAAQGTTSLLVWDLANSPNTRPQVINTGASKVWSASNNATTYQTRWGMVYHAASNSLIAYEPSWVPAVGGQTPLRILTIPTLGGEVDYNPANWIWRDYVGAGVRPKYFGYPALSTTTGTYGKFNIVKDLSPGYDCLVLSKLGAGPTYVMKLPNGAI